MNYRISHYQYKHWQIEEFIEPGEDAKNQEPYWRTLKYPGNLLQAAKGLLDLETGEVTTSDFNELVTAVQGAEKRLFDALESLIVARER